MVSVGAAAAAETAKLHAGLPSVGASPTSLEFGTQSMGTISEPKAVTVSVTHIIPGGTYGLPVTVSNSQFTQTNNCGSVVSPGSCVVEVRFAPAPSAGPVNAPYAAAATLTISSPGCDSIYFPCIRIPLTATAERSLLTHYYRSILRRDPDPSGRAYWDNEVLRLLVLGANLNEAWFAMARSFYASPEYIGQSRDDTGFISDLYGTFFDRPADPSGVAFWSSQLSGGMPRDVVLASFMFSAEFTSFAARVFGNTAARPEVDTVVDFYRGILARLPDSIGFNHWLARFRAAQCQGAAALQQEVEAISSNFTSGTEYDARNRSDGEYVGDLYNAFLRRGGDLAGVSFWINKLQAGAMTRAEMRRAFIASPEFGARVAAIAARTCMQ